MKLTIESGTLSTWSIIKMVTIGYFIGICALLALPMFMFFLGAIVKGLEEGTVWFKMFGYVAGKFLYFPIAIFGQAVVMALLTYLGIRIYEIFRKIEIDIVENKTTPAETDAEGGG